MTSRQTRWHYLIPESLAPDTWVREPHILTMLNKFESERKLALDAGAGTGFFTRILNDMGYFTVALDIISTNVSSIKQNVPSSAPIRADVCALPFKPGTFDVVLCTEVLDHVKGHGKALKELHRVLDDGTLILSVANSNYNPSRIEKFVMEIYEKLTLFVYAYSMEHEELHRCAYTYEDLIREITNVGFNVNQVITIGKTFGMLTNKLFMIVERIDRILRYKVKATPHLADHRKRVSKRKLGKNLIKLYGRKILPLIRKMLEIDIKMKKAGYSLLVCASKVHVPELMSAA